ncbi:TonB-dependent receptor [Phenylobacterium sp.]|jgi:iron complex outermembrane receptor protein|uniref:TonB-dependent receptor n=1 Tax=Phenylobacterium sp. TaxID=1871053 RepID=UPI002F943B3F
MLQSSILRHASVAALLTASALAAGQARAAEAAPQDTAFEVGELVVTAMPYAAQSTANVFTSIDRLSPELIERQNVDNAWELFGRLPGVLLTDFNQGTSSGRFSMRAFNGEGEINAVKLLIDGVPSNSNDGAPTFLDAVFPLEIESLETVRGTLDPRVGLYAIAGSAAIRTRSRGDYVDLRTGVGSWGAREAQAAAGHRFGRLQENVFAGFRESDGYRDHAHLERRGLSGKWTYDLGGGDNRLTASGRYYEAEAQEPGYLTRADARATPRRSYVTSATDGGERTLSQFALAYAGSPRAGVSADLAVYANSFEDTRFVRFSAAVAQQERVADEAQRGVRGAIRWEAPAGALHGLTLEAGGEVQRQEVVSRRYLTDGRIRTRQTRDQRYDLENAGAYVQAVVEPTATLKLIPGWRVDRIHGDYLDRLTGVRAEAYHYGAIHQPKFSGIWTPTPNLMLYGNWGRTFQIGVGSGAYLIPPKTAQLEPSINDGWELGVKHTYAERWQGRVAYWEQTASGEVKRRLNDPLGDSENLGKTRRHGLDIQASYAVTPDLQVWGALTFQKGVVETPDPALPQARGKQIDHVPTRLASGGVDWQATEALSLSLSARAQNAYYLEPTNRTRRFGDFVLADAEATWRLSKRIDIQAQVKNLGDGRSEYVWWDGTQTLHSPGEARSFHLALMARF